MTTIDDYSDLIGYNVVAQRRKSKDQQNTSYCPGVISGLSSKSNKLVIKFGDNEKSEIPINHLSVNDPDNIQENNKYWLNLESIYTPNTPVLANVEYNSDNINYQYGRIIDYNSSAGECTVTFNKFGQINNIPITSIITPCDNRFITGVTQRKNQNILSEEDMVLPERDCPPIKSIDNLGSAPELEEVDNPTPNSQSTSQAISFPFLKYFLIINIIVLVMTGIILYFNFNYFYYKYFSIYRFKFINYTWMVFWWFLISFSLGPFYLIYWIFTQLLDLFNFRFSFNLSSYLGGKCPFHSPTYILLITLITVFYLFLLVKSFKSLDLKKESTQSLKNVSNSNINMDKPPVVSQPNIKTLGETMNSNSVSSNVGKVTSL